LRPAAGAKNGAWRGRGTYDDPGRAHCVARHPRRGADVARRRARVDCAMTGMRKYPSFIVGLANGLNRAREVVRRRTTGPPPVRTNRRGQRWAPARDTTHLLQRIFKSDRRRLLRRREILECAVWSTSILTRSPVGEDRDLENRQQPSAEAMVSPHLQLIRVANSRNLG
jgi:hypothetical protein